MMRESLTHVGRLLIRLIFISALMSTADSQSSCSCSQRASCIKSSRNESWSTTNLRELLSVLLNCYDARVRPTYGDNSPVVISINMFIQSIGKFAVREMDYAISFYLRQRWVDPRLAYHGMFNEDYITLGKSIVQQVWIPDSHFVYKKYSAMSGDIDRSVLFRIFPNGSILYTTENTMTISCYMDLRKFPMDDQTCNLSVESFGFTTRDVVYRWYKGTSGNVIETEKGLDATEFAIVSMVPHERTTAFTTGNYSGLTLQLNLQRRTTYYIIQIYIPCIMIVMLSWISFWIDYQSVPARTALGITTVLAMTTLLFGVQSSLPGVPYIKAVDLFMIVSFACVFVALMEFAVVNYISSYEKSSNGITTKSYTKYDVAEAFTLHFENEAYIGDSNSNNQPSRPTIPHNRQNSVTCNGVCTTGRPRRKRKQPKTSLPCYFTMSAVTIDIYSRAFFPFAYTLFLVVYFAMTGSIIR